MLLLAAETIVHNAQLTLAALREEALAAREALESARAVRARVLDGTATVEDIDAVETAAQAAATANSSARLAHAELMSVHCAALRGDALGFETSDDQRETQPKLEVHSTETTPLKAKKWTVPHHDGDERAAAAMSQSGGLSAAAAAFLAAENALKRRVASGGHSNLYSWRAESDEEASEVQDDAEARQENRKPAQARDFSMFHKELWDRAQKRAEGMLAEQQSGVFVHRETVPKPEKRVPGCATVKLRVVRVNTEEKIVRCYKAMAAGSGADKGGFLLGASLSRFTTLAKEKSDGSEGKNGDLGWITRGKVDAKVEEVAFNCPIGACSPPFRVKSASFNIVFVEDRR